MAKGWLWPEDPQLLPPWPQPEKEGEESHNSWAPAVCPYIHLPPDPPHQGVWVYPQKGHSCPAFPPPWEPVGRWKAIALCSPSPRVVGVLGVDSQGMALEWEWAEKFPPPASNWPWVSRCFCVFVAPLSWRSWVSVGAWNRWPLVKHLLCAGRSLSMCPFI